MNRAPLTDQLDKLAQLTIAIQFDFNSARIRPSSFRAVGLMADALYHPYLQGYRFLIVGHTDAKGNREYNLKLSQQRADAIREALINPFGISPSRIEAVGPWRRAIAQARQSGSGRKPPRAIDQHRPRPLTALPAKQHRSGGLP